jgi:hypothetical protein
VPSWADLTELTGLVNRDFNEELRKVSPRVSLEADLSGDGRTLVQASASATYDRLDPASLAEVISLSGEVTRRRQVGGLGQWPQLPSSAGGGVVATGPQAALIGPELESPRTTRVSLGVSRFLGASSSLHLIGTFRRTEFLLRRSDLNLALAPANVSAEDGRPIYGALEKVGSLVVPDPGSNRRFVDYDVMWALNADGWSDYRGFTLAFEHASEALDLFASYTVSSTEDNLVGARHGSSFARLAPQVEASPASPWENGTSDFDVPHRLSAGLRSRFSIFEGAEVSAVYRFRSGWAFTPGFREGVDVNGDGSGSNDPAYVPADVASAGLSDATCLSEYAGRIAARNACRGSSLHSVDAHVAIGLVRIGSMLGSLTVDAFNVLDTDIGLPDTALLLIDENQAIGQDSSGATVIPTRINPEFGSATRPVHPGRMLRIGFKVGAP